MVKPSLPNDDKQLNLDGASPKQPSLPKGEGKSRHPLHGLYDRPGIDKRVLFFFALSALLHLLFLWEWNQRPDKNSAVKTKEKGIEITLTQLPKSSGKKPEAKPDTKPETKAQPKPKPPPKPELAVRPKPVVRPKPPKIDTKLPEFKDDFPELSTDYAKEAAAAKSLGNVSRSQDIGVHPGAILNINPRIYYPRQAMQQDHRGMVVVLIHIGVDGHTQSVDLIQSSGYEELDNQVIGAVQHWRFKPPERNNLPVESAYRYTVVFGTDERVVDDFENHWQEIRLMPAGG